MSLNVKFLLEFSTHSKIEISKLLCTDVTIRTQNVQGFSSIYKFQGILVVVIKITENVITIPRRHLDVIKELFGKRTYTNEDKGELLSWTSKPPINKIPTK